MPAPPPLLVLPELSWTEKYLPAGLPDDANHPIQIALRTYIVSLPLSLGPSLLPFALSLFSRRKRSRIRARSLKGILKRELGLNGFAFAITVAVAGGAALQRVWQNLEGSKGDQAWEVDLNSAPHEFGAPSADTPPAPSVLKRNEIYQKLRKWICFRDVSPSRKAFLSNLISSTLAIILLQRRRGRDRSRSRPMTNIPIPLTMPIDINVTKYGPSPTLDLTLLLLVRAVDATIQSMVFKKSESYWSRSRNISTVDVLGANRELLVGQPGTTKAERSEEGIKWRQKMTTRIDAFIFWACSARIMWCFFYEPRRLPASYVKWINSLANVDHRLLHILRAIRRKDWSYIHGARTHSHVLPQMSQDLGYPPSWGRAGLLPAYGGAAANLAWQKLGVTSRANVGGFPCEIVHGGLGSRWGLGNGCTVNAAIRLALAFFEAVAIYLPVHFVPIILTRPKSILRLQRVVLPTILRAFRSAAFLSTFVSSCWFGVCFTRSIFFARLFPWISHDVWDGPYGAMLAGSLLCGSSIWIENGRRRGEMALYVLPRAIRSLLPYKWLRSGNKGVKLLERMAFVVSLASLLTAAIYRPDSLRGLSRWTLAFVMRGPNAGFWKRRKIMAQTPIAPTPRPPTPVSESPDDGDEGI